VIHSLANPRPILEARSYPLPGEANMPVSEIDIFDVASKQRAVVQPKNFVDEVLTISDAPQMERDREELREEQEENRLNPTPLSRVSPRWVADTSDKLYFTSRSRDFRHVNMEVADSATGKAQKLIEESSMCGCRRNRSGWWKTEKNYCGGRSGTDGGTCTCMTDRGS